MTLDKIIQGKEITHQEVNESGLEFYDISCGCLIYKKDNLRVILEPLLDKNKFLVVCKYSNAKPMGDIERGLI